MSRPRYSQTEIKTFLRCGKQWEFRYTRGLKVPPGGALTVGRSVDEAVSSNLRRKLEQGEEMSREEVLDAFSDEFDRLAPDTDWAGDRPGQQKDVGATLVELHHSEVSPAIEPASVQERFVIETDAGYDLEGVMDLTEKSGVIVDVKTSRLPYDAGAVSRAFQPAMYDFAYEAVTKEPSSGFRYDVLVKPSRTRSAWVQRVEGEVSAEDRGWLFETIGQVHRAVQAGVALPAPEGSWYCSPRWCGYWSRCKGRKKSS